VLETLPIAPVDRDLRVDVHATDVSERGSKRASSRSCARERFRAPVAAAR
jgi:hypothetical protein